MPQDYCGDLPWQVSAFFVSTALFSDNNLMKAASFEQIISFSSLLAAHKKARCGKQHKKEVIEFEAHLSRNLWALHYDLKYHRYKIERYRKFTIYDPKEREIQAIPYRDRIVQHALCDVLLIPLLENHLIDANCACRRGKGTDYAIKLLRSFMTRHYRKCGCAGYFVKLDIKKYFPSIDHEVLYRKLSRFDFDDDTNWLLHTVIDSYCNGTGDFKGLCPLGEGGVVKTAVQAEPRGKAFPQKGLPMGNQSSQCFALLYLDRIDRFIKERLRVKFYVRYMDDMILLVSERTEARQILESVRLEVEKEKLLLNPKSCIIPVKNGVEFLGWRFKFGKNGKIVQTVKAQSRKRILKKVGKNVCLAKLNKIDDETLSNSLSSYKGHLLRGNGYRLYEKIGKMIKGVFGKE